MANPISLAYAGRFPRHPYAEPREPSFRPSIVGPLELVTSASCPIVSLARAKKHLRVEDDIHDDDDLILDQIAAATALCENEIDGSRSLTSATWDMPLESFWEGPLKMPRPPFQALTSFPYYDTAGTLQSLASSYYLVRTPLRQPGTIERAPDQVWPSLQTDRRFPITLRFLAGYLAPFTAVVATDVLTTSGQAPINGQRVQVWTDNELPGGLQIDTTYFMVSASGQTFKLATSAGGTAIDLTSTGTGTSYVGWVPRTITQAILLLVGHWYANREALFIGSISKDLEYAVASLLHAEGYGAY